jgi:hypothetical protein
MFTQETISEITAVAREIGIEPAALLAVAEVESGGKAFASVEGRLEPLIRFEGHYFDRRLTPAKREAARREGLASPLAGAVINPRMQAARWKLLARAAAIDRKAALESVSWGLGQVMGAHSNNCSHPIDDTTSSKIIQLQIAFRSNAIATYPPPMASKFSTCLKPPALIQIGGSRQLTPRGTFSGGTVSTTFWR